MSMEECIFACAGIGEEDLRAWMLWYGGEMLSPNICMVFDPPEETILALSPL